MADIAYIDLPEKTEKVFIFLSFDRGFYTENSTRFGYGHLLEHCLSAILEDTFGRNAECLMTYSDLQISLVSTRDAITDDFVRLLKLSLSPSPIYAKLLETEKHRVRMEVYEKYTAYHNWLREQIRNSLVSEPEKVRRGYIQQFNTILQATAKEIEKEWQDMVRHAPRITVAANTMDTLPKHILETSTQEMLSDSARAENSPIGNITYARVFSKTLTHPEVSPGYSNVSLLFPVIGISVSNVEDRYILHIAHTALRAMMRSRVERLGAYQLRDWLSVQRNFGYFAFSATFSETQVQSFSDEIFFVCNEIIRTPSILNDHIATFQKDEIADLQNRWNTNDGRIDWCLEDMIDFGRVLTLEELQQTLEQITPEKVTVAIKRLFTRDNLSTLCVVNGPLTIAN